MSDSVTIIGGGLAGLSLGIALRLRHHPARILEAGDYPRHKVCGEFISGAGLQVLDQLGLKQDLAAKGRWASTVSIFNSKRLLFAKGLPEPALCLSRFVLDDFLALRFADLGGELKTGERWFGRLGDPGIINATGRKLTPRHGPWLWFGLKAHLEGLPLQSDLELHFFPFGYVGICRLPNGVSNMCGLFRRRKGDQPIPRDWIGWLGSQSSVIEMKLKEASASAESMTSVAGLAPFPVDIEGGDDFPIGDAMTMTSPVTGNGMSIALESGLLAAEAMRPFLDNRLSWQESRSAYLLQCKKRFATRFGWASWMQKALFNPLGREVLTAVAGRSDRFWKACFHNSRAVGTENVQ